MKCDKQIFHSRTEALATIKGMQNDHSSNLRSKKQPTAVYRCRECGEYHVYTEKKKHSGKKPQIKSVFQRTPKEYGVLVIRNFTGRPI